MIYMGTSKAGARLCTFREGGSGEQKACGTREVAGWELRKIPALRGLLWQCMFPLTNC
jgi:hypothetical protein